MTQVRAWTDESYAARTLGVGALLAIAKALPEFFTENAVARIAADAREHHTYVAEERGGGSEVISGFAIVERREAGVAEILWMAVSPKWRRRGIGTELLSALEDELRAEGFKLLEVKTLAAEARYAPYDGTRRFYEDVGFSRLETVDPYPGWEPANPCAIYVKPL